MLVQSHPQQLHHFRRAATRPICFKKVCRPFAQGQQALAFGWSTFMRCFNWDVLCRLMSKWGPTGTWSIHSVRCTEVRESFRLSEGLSYILPRLHRPPVLPGLTPIWYSRKTGRSALWVIQVIQVIHKTTNTSFALSPPTARPIGF